MTTHAGPWGAGDRFPQTRRSVLLAARDADPEVRRQAWEVLVRSYWKPVYKVLRTRWRLDREDAEDLTQEFFAAALAKGTFERYDPARARFRTYLRTCLDGFAATQHKAAHRLKRGGGQTPIPLDFAGAEAELVRHGAADGLDPEEYFHREWVRALFDLAVGDLRRWCAATGKQVHFHLFERYDLEGPDAPERPTYAELAAEHGLPTTQVTNFLAAVRRELRRLVLGRLRELTASDEEFRSEARHVLGIDPGEDPK
ncbi:MAG TPA: sigma-70 family RNA polymerase sigma factor [Thermoanaerobaculia bacterium]|nr:sigma-70 family RNA polymerase sigma factor [Thermoanaerobaculia bacterium]